MHIAFNATALLSPFTGLGQYTYELARRLVAAPGHEVELFYGMDWGREVREAPLPGAGTWGPLVRRHLPYAYELTRFVKNRRFGARVRGGRFDVYHEPNFLPLEFDGPIVTTVHDLSWIRYPQSHPAERVRAMDRWFPPALARSTHLLTDSAFVQQELVEVFGVDPARITPIPLGVSPLFRPRSAEGTQATLAGHGLRHGRYLLAVGTLEPRKNLPLALRAYAALPAATQEAFPLVLTGMMGWNSDALEREMAPLLAAGRLRLTGYVPRAALAELVAGARLMLYPSVYEGFGLPPLEAMASGVPPVVAEAASLPEVVGDAGLRLAPDDVGGWKEAIARLVEDDALRAQLADRCVARAGTFSWDRCAAETMAVYRQVATA